MADSRDKIVTIGQLAQAAAGLRQQGKSLVLCHGDFDLLHPGHIRHLEAAKRHGDVLAVALTADEHVEKGPGRPFFHRAPQGRVPGGPASRRLRGDEPRPQRRGVDPQGPPRRLREGE